VVFRLLVGVVLIEGDFNGDSAWGCTFKKPRTFAQLLNRSVLAIWFETTDRLDAGDTLLQALQGFISESRAVRADLLKQSNTFFQRLQRNVGLVFEIHHLDDQFVPLGKVFNLIAKQIGKTFCVLRNALDRFVELFTIARVARPPMPWPKSGAKWRLETSGSWMRT
jgi:hypothetical protein